MVSALDSWSSVSGSRRLAGDTMLCCYARHLTLTGVQIGTGGINAECNHNGLKSHPCGVETRLFAL